MIGLSPATGDCKRCGTAICTCRAKRRETLDLTRHSPIQGAWESQTSSHRRKQRQQWAHKPSEGDLGGGRATPAERKALRRRYLQERPHDGKPDKFPK